MNDLYESIVRSCVSNTKDLLNKYPDLQWPPEMYWWPGIQLAWVRPFSPGIRCQALTVTLLNKSLIERGVPASSIKKLGAYTLLELDNIAFVYRDRQYKYENGPVLQISPHLLGCKFKECGHAFVSPNCSEDALAEYILMINRIIPATREACIAAYNDLNGDGFII